MSISVDVRHRLGEFDLRARFESQGRLTVLFGRSGAGKTSLVNIIGGLVRPDHGRVVVDGETLVDTERGVFLPPHRRRLGYVFQEGRLFPHMTVRQNLLYGRWFAARGERREGLDQVVDLLGLAHLLDRRPARLSGGEKQRVAFGRAILARPRLLLMDEPLASLDEERKAEILPYVERLRDDMKIPIVYVSHSVAEVARLATTIVVLSAGRVSAVGSPGAVLSRAELFQKSERVNLGAVMEAVVLAHDDTFHLTHLTCRAGVLMVPHLDLAVGATVRIRISARDVMLALAPPDGLSAVNVLPASITALDAAAEGGVVDVQLDCNGETIAARLTLLSVERLCLRPGLAVFAVIKSIAFDDRSFSPAPRPPETDEEDECGA